MFQKTLRSNPNFPDALLELANLRIAKKKFAEAAELLRRYVKASRDPAAGYYKLAMVERQPPSDRGRAARSECHFKPCRKKPRTVRIRISTCLIISTAVRPCSAGANATELD